MVAVVKVLVTGGTGHIGNVVVRKLVASGADVRVLVYDDRPSLEEVEVERIQGDVRDAEAVSRALQGVEVVWHLAAVIAIDGDPKGLARSVNIDGAKTVAREALRAGVRRMVHVSSIHAFDHAPHFETLDESRQRAGQHHPGRSQERQTGDTLTDPPKIDQVEPHGGVIRMRGPWRSRLDISDFFGFPSKFRIGASRKVAGMTSRKRYLSR
jgi:nucleoside-diphosphate-sugar epimerase